MIDIATLTANALTAVPALQKTVLAAAAFSTDFSADVISPGASVQVNVIGTPTAAKTLGEKYSEDADGNVSFTSLKLNEKPIHKTFKLTRAQALDAQKGGDVLTKLLASHMQAVAEAVIAAPFAAFTESLLGDALYTVAPDAIAFKDLAKIKTAGTKAGFPSTGRKLILSSETYDALLGDDKVTNIVNTGIATGAVSDGLLPRLAGMDVIESPSMPDVDGAIGFLLLPRGVALAARAFEPVAANDTWTTVVEPNSGLPMVVKAWSNADTEDEFVSVSCLFGFKVLQPEAIRRITAPSGSTGGSTGD